MKKSDAGYLTPKAPGGTKKIAGLTKKAAPPAAPGASTGTPPPPTLKAGVTAKLRGFPKK